MEEDPRAGAHYVLGDSRHPSGWAGDRGRSWLMTKRLFLLLVFTLLFGIQGCDRTILPISSGARGTLPKPDTLALVWGNHVGAVAQAEGMLKKFGRLRIVELSRLQQVLYEQNISPEHSAENEFQILKVGKILRVDSVVFVDVQMASHHRSQANGPVPQIHNSQGLPAETVRHLRVSVWGIKVPNGEVMWSGKAYYPQPMNNPEQGILSLTRVAIGRGTCPTGAWREVDNICDWTLLIGKGRIGIETEWREGLQGRILVINNVLAGLPAEKAGLAAGDVVMSCNGITDLQNVAEFMLACRADPGQSVAIEIQRKGKPYTFIPTAISGRAPMR